MAVSPRKRIRRVPGKLTRWPLRLLGRQSDSSIPWDPSLWDSSTLFHWFHGGVPGRGLASTIQGGVGNTTTGWNDGSGNARHVSGTINGTPNVVKPNSLEGINFTKADAEYLLQTSYNATSDVAGTRWIVYQVASGTAESGSFSVCGFAASGSGSRYELEDLFSSGGNLTPRVRTSNGTNTTSDLWVSGANNVIPGNTHSLVFEANETGTSYRLWADEVEITGGSLSQTLGGSAVAGQWWNTINGGSQLNRFAIGTTPTNAGVATTYFNGIIFEVGARRAVLGTDETNFLAHLTRQRGLA